MISTSAFASDSEMVSSTEDEAFKSKKKLQKWRCSSSEDELNLCLCLGLGNGVINRLHFPALASGQLLSSSSPCSVSATISCTQPATPLAPSSQPAFSSILVVLQLPLFMHCNSPSAALRLFLCCTVTCHAPRLGRAQPDPEGVTTEQEDEEMLVPHSDFATEGPQPMEVAPQTKAASTVENQPVEDPPSSRFTWTIENFSRLNTKKHYSDVFFVGDYKWRVLIFPKGNNVTTCLCT
ncbi:hypothetical protein MRB53_023577 [Persea americana]|uniref:Uncharacterized protein n=1 Tax=Persea americana TaxID=3435 RepID=A0ACC2LB28_PERAE|nr:hypothetical protein MRB53_023577 [Persea americana]